MAADQSIEVSRVVHAPAATVFALLADPRRHPETDGSGTLRAAPDAVPITGVGDAFVMHLEADDLGAYRSRSVVVRHEPDRALGWSPGPADGEPFGHTYVYVLDADGPDRTVVTQTYDWSAVTDPHLRPTLPRVSRDELARSLDLLARIVENEVEDKAEVTDDADEDGGGRTSA